MYVSTPRESPPGLFKNPLKRPRPSGSVTKLRGSNNTLQSRVEVRRAKQDLVVSKSLIETAIRANRLFGFQRRIAESDHAC